jgi:hypothetical protein
MESSIREYLNSKDLSPRERKEVNIKFTTHVNKSIKRL